MDHSSQPMTPKAAALEERFACFISGIRYGYHRATDPSTCPPISERIVGDSFNNFENGCRLGYLEGFRKKQR
jgi:hypothetical protein